MTEDRSTNVIDQSDLPNWLEEITTDETAKAAPVKQRFSTMSIILVLASVAVLAMIGYALLDSNKTQPQSGPAPDFSVVTYDVDQISPFNNVEYSLDGLKGQVIVINFWATNCEPCLDEAPMLQQLWEEYHDAGQGVLFLGVNTRDDASIALPYLRRFGITFPNAPDRGDFVEDSYRITGTPETFVIDANGKIVHHFLGPVTQTELRQQIERALAA